MKNGSSRHSRLFKLSTIQNEEAAKSVSAACLYRLFDRYFYLRENENKLDGFIILNL